MLQVKNLSKEFTKLNNQRQKEKFLANENMSFTAQDGEIIGIIGPNGAGKTTLLRMIAGLLTPTQGKIIIDDLQYPESEIAIKKKFAYLSGNTKIYNTLTPYELLQMWWNFYEVAGDFAKRLTEITTILNLQDFLYSPIAKLSTGQVQRVNIARCLIHDPKYYIFDEATSGLDIISSQIILDFIKQEKKRGKTILYSTHYMEEVDGICDRIILIDKGQIIENDTPENIKKKTKTTNLRDAFFALIGGKYDK